MSLDVRRYDDARSVLDLAELFVARDAILNNVILTLLATRTVHPDSGRYWTAFQNGEVVGMAMQSPFDRPVIVSAMPIDIVGSPVKATV